MTSKSNKRNLEPQELPLIPDKLYFSIGEAGKLCQLEAHVLRYWEQEFPKQIKPVKRRGRRHYRREDILAIRHIRELLHHRGYTIEGARQYLAQDKTELKPVKKYCRELEKILQNLQHILDELQPVAGA